MDTRGHEPRVPTANELFALLIVFIAAVYALGYLIIDACDEPCPSYCPAGSVVPYRSIGA